MSFGQRSKSDRTYTRVDNADADRGAMRNVLSDAVRATNAPPVSYRFIANTLVIVIAVTVASAFAWIFFAAQNADAGAARPASNAATFAGRAPLETGYAFARADERPELARDDRVIANRCLQNARALLAEQRRVDREAGLEGSVPARVSLPYAKAIALVKCAGELQRQRFCDAHHRQRYAAWLRAVVRQRRSALSRLQADIGQLEKMYQFREKASRDSAAQQRGAGVGTDAQASGGPRYGGRYASVAATSYGAKIVKGFEAQTGMPIWQIETLDPALLKIVRELSASGALSKRDFGW
ncbi:MAG: hypothetical protein AAGG99_08740, partial [Pseudomonadota bacterium]